MIRAPSGLEPRIRQSNDVRAGLGSEVLTTRPDTNLYMRSEFIMMCFGDSMKTKENQFCHFPEKSDLFGKKFLHQQLPNMMMHTHEKFAPLDFIKK